MGKITTQVVNEFLQGRDPMERIVAIECDYMDDEVSIIYVDENGTKRIKKDAFMPFVWAKHSAAIRLFEGNRAKLKKKLQEYGISVKALSLGESTDGEISERIENGYKYLFYAFRKMSYGKFSTFFKEARSTYL